MSPTKFAYVVPGHANTNSPGPAGAPTFSGAELGVAGGSRQTNVQPRDDEHRHARTLRRGVEDPPGLVIGRVERRAGAPKRRARAAREVATARVLGQEDRGEGVPGADEGPGSAYDAAPLAPRGDVAHARLPDVGAPRGLRAGEPAPAPPRGFATGLPPPPPVTAAPASPRGRRPPGPACRRASASTAKAFRYRASPHQSVDGIPHALHTRAPCAARPCIEIGRAHV